MATFLAIFSELHFFQKHISQFLNKKLSLFMVFSGEQGVGHAKNSCHWARREAFHNLEPPGADVQAVGGRLDTSLTVMKGG